MNPGAQFSARVLLRRTINERGCRDWREVTEPANRLLMARRVGESHRKSSSRESQARESLAEHCNPQGHPSLCRFPGVCLNVWPLATSWYAPSYHRDKWLRLVAVSHHLRQNVERTVGCGGLGSGPVLARREGIHLRLTRERMIDPEPSPGKTGHVAKGW